MSISGWSQSTEVTIGNGGSTSLYVPTGLFYKNSASQIIYLQSEINTSGYIAAISFKNNYSSSDTNIRNIRVYMATTQQSEFATTSSYLSLDSTNLVYEGAWVITYGQWSEIVLDNPFYYDNTSNLVIGIEDFTGWYPGNNRYWETSSGTNRCLYKSYDSSPVNITFDGYTPSKANNFPNVKMTLVQNISDYCYAPRNIRLVDTTTSSATITWASDDNASSFYYQLKPSTDSWDENGYISTTDTIVVFSDLQAATTYDFRIYTDCGISSQSTTKTISFSTACALIDSVPYTWNFEANNTGGTTTYPLPACWDRVGSYPYSYTSTTHAVSGSKVLYFFANNRYGILPQIDTDNLPINTLQISFYAKKGTATGNNIQVGVMTNIADTSTFVPVATLDLTTNYRYYDVSLEEYSGDGQFIAIKTYGTSSSGYTYVDDVTLTLAPDCSRPTEVSIMPSAYEFSATWKSTATNFEIYYKQSSDATYQVTHNYSENQQDSTWSVTISDEITPNTNYDFYIKAICNDGTELLSQTFSFTTSCVALDVPYTMDFESVAVGERPSCWSFLNSTSTGFPYVSSSSYRGHNSAKGLEFRSTSSVSTASIAIMPEFTENITNLSVEFWSKPESNPATNSYSSGRLEVGYVTNPLDASSFVMLDSISVYTLEDSTYHKYRVNFDNIDLGDATTGYIAFRHVSNGNYYWYLDDVTVELVPDCQEPDHLNVESFAANSVELSWQSTQETLNLLYKDTSSVDWITIENVSLNEDSVYVLQNLSPNTTYQWKLSFVCASDDETYTSETKQFTTECVGITTLPMTWDFESGNTAGTTSNPLPGCWKRIGTTYPRVYSSSTYAHQGSYSLYFSGNSKYAILQPIDTTVLPINTLQLSFYASRNSYANNIQVGVMTDPTDTNTFVIVDTFNITTLYKLYQVSFALYQGTGEYIALRSYGSSSASIYVDDMTLDVIPSCSEPMNLDVTVSSNSVDVTWTSTGNDFIIYYKENGASDYQTTTSFTALEQSGSWTATISDLTSATNYNLYIEALCSEENISSETVVFMTSCMAISTVPKTWDFETADNSLETYPMPLCWTRIGNSTTYPYSFSYSSAYSGSRVLYFSGTDGRYAVLPQIDTNALSLNTLQLSFYAKKSSDVYNTKIQVGIMSSPIDTNNITLVSSIDLTTDWLRYEIPFSSFSGYGQYIVLEEISAFSASAYVDLMTLEAIPSCSRPNELMATNVLENQATITWISTGNNFEVYYKQSYDSVYTMTTDFTSSTEDNNWQITLNNLQSSTNYDIYVKVICEDNYEDFSNVLTFASSCAVITTVPQDWDFETYGNNKTISYSLPLCWTRTGLTPTTYPYSYTTAANAVSGSGVLYFYGKNKYAVLPQIDTNILPINTLQLSFYAKTTSTTFNALQVGVMTDPMDTNTFTLISSIQINNNTQITYDIPLASYTGIGEYIAIRSYGSNTSATIYLDDLHLSIIPTCTRPTNITATTTEQQATITWKSTSNNFEIYYKKCEDETYTMITNFSAGVLDSTWTTTITDLNPATNYDLYIKTTCSDNTEFESNMFSFSTSCVAISTVPQTWDFEACGNTIETYPLPLGWTRTGSSSTQYPYSYTSSSYATSGTKTLYFYGRKQYAVLPQIDTNQLPLNTLQLSFYGKRGTTAGNTIQVGIMTNPTDTNTFTLISNLTLTTTHFYYEVPLTSYAGTGGYIAIRYYGSSTSATAYLDDVTLEIAPACTRPAILTVTPSTEEVTLTWKSSADNFEIYYKEASDSIYENTSDFTATTQDSIWTSNLFGLTPATKYDIYVKAICDDNSEVNSFVSSFRTLCLEVSEFPYTEDFEQLSETDLGCWTNENISGSTSWTIKTSSVGKVAYRSYTTGAKSRLISPIFDITSLSQPKLSYNWEVCSSGNNLDSLYVYYRTNVGNEWVLLTSHGSSYSGNNTSYTASQFDSIMLPDASETYQIAFLAVGHNGYGVYLDNVVVSDDDGSVVTPVEPTVATNVATNIAQTSVTLNGTITDAGNQTITAKGFEWKATNGGTYAQLLSSDAGNTFTYNLTNLTANTSYTYRAFATTANGTVYGAEVVFTTLEAGEEPCTPVTASITETLCYGETFTFNGQTYNATGTYQTTVAGQNGDCDTNYTINLTILPQNTASITETLCNGETFTFNGQTYNATGTYQTTVAGQNGDCDTNYTINLTILPQNAPINDEVTISQSELPYEYHGQTYNDFGTYSVTLQDENGCDQVYNLTLVHNSGIAEVEEELTISLYPNPTDNNATLRVKGLNEQATIIITDQQGRVIQTKVLPQGTETFEIESERLASGVYYIRIQTTNTIRTEKLIKK